MHRFSRSFLFAAALLLCATLEACAAVCPTFAAGDLNYISKLNQVSAGCTPTTPPDYSLLKADAGGTVDAITATYTPAVSLTDKVTVGVIVAGANTSTTPTFAPNGLTAHTITTRGGGALVAGDIGPAGFVALLEYNAAGTRWELMNPVKRRVANDVSGLASGMATWLGSGTSADLATALTDETGSSGGFVRAGSPTLTGTVTAASAAFSDSSGANSGKVISATNTRASGTNYAIDASATGSPATANYGGRFSASGATVNVGVVISGPSGGTESGSSYALVVDATSPSYFSGNLTLGSPTGRSTTDPSHGLNIFNGTAPSGTLTNGVTLYSSSGALKVMDAAGTVSTPVVADTGASNNFLTAVSAAGVISKAQPAFSNLSGSVAASQMPALTGDVTTSAGAVATAIGATKVTSAMLNADVFSTAHSWGGVQTLAGPTVTGTLAGATSTWSGTLTIGTGYTPAGTKLEVGGASGNQLSRFTSGTNDLYVGYDTGLAGGASQTIESKGDLALAVGASYAEKARLTTTGLGVGVAPSYQLHAEQSSNARVAHFKNTNASFTDSALVVDTTRATNSAFKLIDLYAGGARQFTVDGVGTITGGAVSVTNSAATNSRNAISAANTTSGGTNVGIVASATGTSSTSNTGGSFSASGGTVSTGLEITAPNGGVDGGSSQALVVSGTSPSYFAGNIHIGSSAGRGTTNPTASISIYNGTAPAGTLTNGATFYATSGEMRVMDSAGNATLLSPHCDRALASRKLCQFNDWIMDTTSATTGKRLVVEMERLLKALDKKLGGGFVHELPAKKRARK